MPLPEFIIRLQRREYFRITTPEAKPILLSASLSEKGGNLSLPLHDLSVAGCGLLAGAVPLEFDAVTELPDCRFMLPDAHKTWVSTRGIVRHMTPVSGRPSAHRCRIGLQFDGLEHVMEHRIQRYIVQVEHDRRELLGS